ncbi:MAG: transposase [Bdellovibrionaceae bacterium]|nr:transposase [Pseudobdellovibrionaceae bacterium]
MPWKEVKPVDERLRFIHYALEKDLSMVDLCELMGVSRKTGYKWLKRYEEDGIFGLFDQTREPFSNPNKMCNEHQDLILKTRKQHPSWGAPKIHAYLKRKSFKSLPAVSSMGRLLKKCGLTNKKPKSRLLRLDSQLTSPKEVNEVWAADFKGDFTGRCGTRNYPLTVTDLQTRYLLLCKGQKNTAFTETKMNFSKLFTKYGLPKIIRTDNGVPFTGSGGLSQLSVWWCELGIQHELIRPGKPHENGSHERMHRTLKADAINTKQFNFNEQQKIFDNFKEIFNYERPHEGIKNKVPGELYKKSQRKMPATIKLYNYPDHFKVTEVNGGGCFYLNRKRYYLSHVLENKWIGLEPIDKELWSIYYRDKMIAIYDENDGQLRG